MRGGVRAPVELGAALAWTPAGAQLLMGDGLELRYRLPRMWSLVLDLRAPVHLAREIAQHTRKPTYDAARWAGAAGQCRPGSPRPGQGRRPGS